MVTIQAGAPCCCIVAKHALASSRTRSPTTSAEEPLAAAAAPREGSLAGLLLGRAGASSSDAILTSVGPVPESSTVSAGLPMEAGCVGRMPSASCVSTNS
eukprot:9802106-Lingulodinium_polyedra.AAC.1